jgi:hypothetical protein
VQAGVWRGQRRVGFILGPFVYFGHEWVWDRFSLARQSSADLPADRPKLLAFRQLARPGRDAISPAFAGSLSR